MELITAYTGDPLGLQIAELQLRSWPTEQEHPWTVYVTNINWRSSVEKLIKRVRPKWRDVTVVVPLSAAAAYSVTDLHMKYIRESIGFKTILPLLHDDFLFLDSDIVITRPPEAALGCGDVWASRQGIDRWYQKGSLKAGTAVLSPWGREVRDVCGVKIWGNGAADGAMLSVPRIFTDYTRDAYVELLKDFWSMPIVNVPLSATQYFQLDQRFLTTWLARDTGCAFVNGGTAVLYCGGEPEPQKLPDDHPLFMAYGAATNWKNGFRHDQKFPNRTFWHYSVSGCKPEAIAKYSAWLKRGGGFKPEFVR